MKRHIYIVALLAFLVTACNFDDDTTAPNYVTFESDAINLGVGVNSTASYDLVVYSGNITGNTRTFDVIVSENSSMDTNAFTVSSNVTIPAGTNEGIISIEVQDYAAMGISGETIELSLAPTSGITIATPVTFTVSRTCPGEEFNVSFAFDGYASEVAWSILDSEGSTLLSVSGYDDGTASASRDVCLSSGNYTFTVTDAYGDGLTYPETGSITLSYAGEVITVIDGDYGAGTSYEFSL